MAERKSQVGVKNEPGSYKRLPSLRSPRDLTLSEFRSPKPEPDKTKKLFVPNLNVQRKKTDEPQQPLPTSSKGSEREKREERGRGRGKKMLIQGSGIFSEGLAPSMKGHRWSSKNSSEPSMVQLQKPVLKGMDGISVNKEEEEGVIKNLIRDDFIDDPEADTDQDCIPISLPFFKPEPKFHIKEEPKIGEVNVVVKVKEEKDEDTKEFINDVKPTNIGQLRPLTISEILSEHSSDPLFFIQVPMTMPRVKGLNDDRSKTLEGEPVEEMNLMNLPEGQIGKIQILQSGKTRLQLGEVPMWLEVGTQSSFRQDLMSVKLDHSTHTGEMNHLSSVSTKIIATPDWDSLLK